MPVANCRIRSKQAQDLSHPKADSVDLIANPLPNSATQVLVAANPNAGARSGKPKIDRLAELLREAGFEPTVTSNIDEIASLSQSLLASGQLRAVVAAGGDGTVDLVVNNTDPTVPLTILPLGTENLLSKYLKISPDPEFVCRTIADGVTLSHDAGRVGNQVFSLMLSCGFDAEVVRRVHEERSGHIHQLAYAKPILDSILNYQYPELRVYCDDEEPIFARWCFVFNLPKYAMGLRIAPEAIGHDGLLDVCTFKDGSLISGLTYLSGIVLGQHQSWRDCTVKRAVSVRIESDGDVPFEVDGDPGGKLPADIEVLPNRLTLLASPDWAEGHGYTIKEQVDEIRAE